MELHRRQGEALSSIKDAIECRCYTESVRALPVCRNRKASPSRPTGLRQNAHRQSNAYNLTRKLSEKTGKDMKECFLHIKGPEILTCGSANPSASCARFSPLPREAPQGFMPFMFIDEAESIPWRPPRQPVFSNILSTLVPMFCSEMDASKRCTMS